MSDPLVLSLVPGKVFQAGELVTLEKLNLLGNPVVSLSGAVTTRSLDDGSVTTAKLATNALANSTFGRTKMEDNFLSATADGLKKMQDGFLSADTNGRKKMADGFLSADTTGRLKMANGFVTDPKVGYAEVYISLEPNPLVIDWAVGYAFHKILSANDAFTFANSINGKTITVVLNGGNGGPFTPSFAGVKWANGVVPGSIPVGKSMVLSFLKANNEIMGSFTNSHA